MLNNIFPKTLSHISQSRDGNIRMRMRFARCIPKATESRLEYVIRMTLQLKQWLQERVNLIIAVFNFCFIRC